MSQISISGTNESVWTFPSQHNVKAIGFSQHPVQSIFETMLKELKLSYNIQKTPAKQSSSGKYVSVTIQVTFTAETEVKELYARLHAHPHIIQSL